MQVHFRGFGPHAPRQAFRVSCHGPQVVPLLWIVIIEVQFGQGRLGGCLGLHGHPRHNAFGLWVTERCLLGRPACRLIGPTTDGWSSSRGAAKSSERTTTTTTIPVAEEPAADHCHPSRQSSMASHVEAGGQPKPWNLARAIPSEESD